MSMWKIAKFLRINGTLDGVEREHQRWFSLPGQASTGRQRLWTGVAGSMFFEGSSRYLQRGSGRSYSRGV